jgi:primosomal protein N' (replication factor Y)
MAKQQDFAKFYDQESRFRRELSYPPFSRLINCRIEGTSQRRSMRAAQEMGQWGARLLKEMPYGEEIEILGPSPAPLAKLKGKYRYHMLIKGKRANPLHRFVKELVEEMNRRWGRGEIGLSIDVDPISVM